MTTDITGIARTAPGRGHLRVIPYTLKQANQFIAQHHRHHKPVQGHRFSLACVDSSQLICGVCVVGRPTARETPQYKVGEVTRMCTDGASNACSILYAAAARVCREMGFEKIQTFILENESGVSLKAAGWVFEQMSNGGNWNRPSRGKRRTDQPMNAKQRWVKHL